MAIGTAAAIGLGLGAVGSIIGGKSQQKAAQTASDTSMQVAQQNNALARDIYGQNKGVLSPYINRGNAAGEQLNAMLGLGGPANAGGNPGVSNNIGQATLPTQQPNVGVLNSSFDSTGRPLWTGRDVEMARPSYDAKYGYVDNPTVDRFGFGMMPQYQAQGGAPQAAPQQQPNVYTANNAVATNAGDPFRQYIANSDYAFQFGEGANRVNSGYAGAGALQSGAAMRAMEGFRQNLQQGYRNEYMGYLGQQQGAGLSAGGALAGVGMQHVSQVSANNNAAGTAAANAALAKGANNPWANAFGLAGGVLTGL